MNLDHLLQRLLGRATCVLGPGARLTRHARIRNIRGDSQSITVGEHSVIAGELLSFRHGGSIAIGRWCYVGEGSRIWSAGSIRIGDRVLISHNVNIFDSLTHPLSAKQRHQQFRAIAQSGHPQSIDLGERPITIGDDAWIGANASILRGVSIGIGAVVAIGAVVTHDVAPYTIVGGNPAKTIRELRDDER
ncbi:MAG TPA: acyltransferase [Rhodocyclaceae bacterium]